MKLLLILMASASWAWAAEPAWKITGPEREQAVYAGQPVTLAAWVSAEKGSATSAVVRVEVWQAGGDVAVPLRKEAGPQAVRIGIGATNRIEIPWTSPDVRGRSRFALRLSAEGGRSLGTVMVTAHPTNLFGEFADLLAAYPVRLVNAPKPVEKWFAEMESQRADHRLHGGYGAALRWVGNRGVSSGKVRDDQGVELSRTTPTPVPAGKQSAQPWVTIDPGLFLRLDREPEALLQLMDLLRRSSQFDASRPLKTERPFPP